MALRNFRRAGGFALQTGSLSARILALARGVRLRLRLARSEQICGTTASWIRDDTSFHLLSTLQILSTLENSCVLRARTAVLGLHLQKHLPILIQVGTRFGYFRLKQ